MLISHKWLSKYVDVNKDDLYDDLSVYTAEVEGVEELGNLPNVVIGHVKSVKAHPNADKLRVAMVDTGEKKERQIVCGAANLEEGQKVPVAIPGAVLGEDFVIKEAKLRDVLSQGMICSEDELGLTKERQPGIMVLPESAPVGESLTSFLQLEDSIFEIENKSITNRPDLFGHYGLAREVSVIYDTPLRPYMETTIENNDSLPALNIEIENPKLCRRYMGVQIDNVKPKESPMWLKTLLESVGHRSINTVVDVTNYILMDLGQPMHAFDTAKIKTGKIRIGFNKPKEEEVECITGDSALLKNTHLAIKDGTNPIAIAGVMGLANSEVDENTDSIILESANFDGSHVRKVSKETEIRSESSIRFEKKLNPEHAQLGMEKAIAMILKLHPEASVVSQITDIYPNPYPEVTIDSSFSFIEARVGEPVGADRITKILESLGFQLEVSGDTFSCVVPSWRATGDVSMEEDLVEEIVQMVGFNNLKGTLPAFPLAESADESTYTHREHVRDILAQSHGLMEAWNYDFYSKSLHANSLLEKDIHKDPIAVLNPISKENEIMRTSMIPLLLEDLKKNTKYGTPIGMYEFGRIYPKRGGKVYDEKARESFEEERIGIILGKIMKDPTNEKEAWENHPYFALKAIIDDLIHRHHMDSKVEIRRPEKKELELYPWMHPGKAAIITINGTIAGAFGEVHPLVMLNNNIKKYTAVACELSNSVWKEAHHDPKLESFSDLPPVHRDVSFVMDQKQEVGPLLEFVGTHHETIEDVRLTDLYEGQGVPEGKKSVTISITFYHPKKTLTDKAINHIAEGLFTGVKKSFKAELRA